MDFKIKNTEYKRDQLKDYAEDELDIAYKFSKVAYQELGSILKTVVLFGSSAKHEQKENSDIDILIVLDDLTVVWTNELAQTYRIITEKKVHEISSRIHITTIKLTTFWEYVRNGDPVGINILRDGIALIDTGFFDPLKILLKRGSIRPSSESVWNYMTKGISMIDKSRAHLMSAVVDLYWACVDSSHAALMRVGVIPPSPEHVSQMLKKHLVSKGLLAASHVKTMDDFYRLYKGITHRKIEHVVGNQYEQYAAAAESLVDAMRKIVERKDL